MQVLSRSERINWLQGFFGAVGTADLTGAVGFTGLGGGSTVGKGSGSEPGL
jgi:hypothetical protein